MVLHVHIGRLGSLASNSFRWRAIRLFNDMLKYIRCISSCEQPQVSSSYNGCSYLNSFDGGIIDEICCATEDGEHK